MGFTDFLESAVDTILKPVGYINTGLQKTVEYVRSGGGIDPNAPNDNYMKDIIRGAGKTKATVEKGIEVGKNVTAATQSVGNWFPVIAAMLVGVLFIRLIRAIF